MRRTGRLAAAAAALAATAAVLVAPAALAQSSDAGLLTVRGIDATDRDAVKLTLLWTGDAKDLEDLTIREDGATKKVQDLTDLRKTDTRLGTVVAVDLSGSMGDGGALTRAKDGIRKMAADLPDGDQLAIVSFTDSVVVESTFTDDVDQIDAALDEMAAPRDGKTATYDGLRKAVSLFASRPNLQPNVVVITDGKDDASTSDLAQARASVVGSGAATYAIELTHTEEVDEASLQSIIDRTGGAAFAGGTETEVEQAFTELSTTMRSQYVATYKSSVDQGAVDVSVTVGSTEEQAAYVAGDRVQGAATTQVANSEKAFGPTWLRSSAGAILAFVLVGLAVGLGTFAFGALATKDESGLQSMLRPYSDGPATDGDEVDTGLAQTAILQRAVEMTEDFAQRQGFLEKVERMLERADMPLRAAEAMFFYGAGVLALGVMAFVGLGFVPGLVVFLLAALLPPAIVNFKAGRRSKAFVAILPDTLQLLSGSLRAGYSFMQGVEAVSQEVEDPMGKELRRVITEARLGREIEDSMDGVAERMDSPDFAWAVMAVRIQREVGGNLSELLLTVGETMVHRDRLRREVAGLTAEGKMSAIILGLLPIGLGAFMWMSNPVYMSPLSETLMGNVLLGVAVLAAGIGFLWMKKTITIKI
jgi:tight adherence protein B